MKKLTLDQTWERCLAMWKWIAEQVEKAIRQHKRKPCIEDLKTEWLDLHGFGNDSLNNNCFFCEYNKYRTKSINKDCWCPARLVDKGWTCFDEGRVFDEHPIAFYNKIKALNKIRLERKKK